MGPLPNGPFMAHIWGVILTTYYLGMILLVMTADGKIWVSCLGWFEVMFFSADSTNLHGEKPPIWQKTMFFSFSKHQTSESKTGISG